MSLCAHEADEKSHEGKFVNIAIDVSQENSLENNSVHGSSAVCWGQREFYVQQALK